MKTEQSLRLGTIGGQAVLEGIMMKSKNRYAVAMRTPDGTIQTKIFPFVSLSERYPLLSLPVLRGAANFFQMLMLGHITLQISSEAILSEADTPKSKFELWLENVFGEKLSEALTVLSYFLAVFLSIALFMFLPAYLIKGLERVLSLELGLWKNLFEGVVRLGILIAYLLLISMIPDMKRTFEYHGAEHKVILCYEAEEQLTPRNAQKHKRFHPRCGTSFIFVMILTGMIFYSLPWFTWDNILVRTLTKVLLFPLIAGLGYEFIRFAGKHPGNHIVSYLSLPGLWIQRITTKEPSLEQLEISIAAIQGVISQEEHTNKTIF